jgi:hypothetical protein
MSLSHRDIKNIQVLAKEGKEPGLVHSENYPEETRQDIDNAYYEFIDYSPRGAISSIGRKNSILMKSATDKDKLLLNELVSLSSLLYKTLSSNQKKLDDFRKILS